MIIIQDWTLVETKSGKTFPQNVNDWKFWHDSKVVPDKLRSLYEDQDYRIVVFTNQGGVEMSHTSIKELETKFTNIYS